MGDAEPAGDVGDGDLAVLEQPGLGDVVVVAQVGHRDAVEGPTGTGDIAGGVETLGRGRCW